MWSFLPICCAGGFGPFSQGTCTNKINNLEVAIESCKTAEAGGVGNLSQVFSKASEDVAAAKAGAEKLTTLEPSAVNPAGCRLGQGATASVQETQRGPW